MIWLLMLFCAFYLTALFPFAFFRHDDWLIALNGASLQTNWQKLWSPTLMHGATERIWFFRPLVKFNGFLFWKLFGEHYYFWLASTLFFTVGALVFAYRSLNEFPPTQKKSLSFLILFVCAPLIHFGSLTWIGEGLMNCPQIFFLALSLWAFLKSVNFRDTESRPTYFIHYTAVALLAFLIALGIKESSIFHVIFLMAILRDNKFNRRSWKNTIRCILPYAIISSIFLIFRLFFVPMNGDYVLGFTLAHLGTPVLYFLMILGTPVFLLYLFGAYDSEVRKTPFLTLLKEDIFYLIYFAISVVPFLGQPFFSVGWPLLTGFFFIFYLATKTKPMLTTQKIPIALALLLVQGVPAMGYLGYLHWWDWQKPEYSLLKIVEISGADVSTIRIANCQNHATEHLSFERVVTHASGLNSLWILKNGHPVDIISTSCDSLDERQPSKDELVLRWEFPELTLVSSPLQIRAPLEELLTLRPALPSRRSESHGPRPLSGSRFPSSSPPSP